MNFGSDLYAAAGVAGAWADVAAEHKAIDVHSNTGRIRKEARRMEHSSKWKYLKWVTPPSFSRES
jgi:hypothetical protein